MRLYTFSHRMLSPVQQIIQGLHATVEMFNIYVWDELYQEPCYNENNFGCGWSLYNWSNKHKTHIALTAGGSKEIKELWQMILSDDNNYPFANFHEDQDSLEGLMTSIAIVLPEKIYEASSLYKRGQVRFVGDVLSVTNWEKYNVEFNLEEFDKLQKQMSSYGEYNEFDKWLVENLGNYSLVR